MSLLLVLPIIMTLATALLCLITMRWLNAQRMVAVAGAAGLLTVSLILLHTVQRHGIITMQIGNWPAPYGITFVADLFSATMVVITALMGLLIAIYSLTAIDNQRLSFGYFVLFHVLLMGVCGAFLTGDIFNLYVWFEVLLMASFVMMVLGGERGQMQGAIKYVTMNLLASAFFLIGCGILYGKTGTLNMADLAHKLSAVPNADFLNSTAMLFLIAFGIKAAIFPLFFWLPASYHTPPVTVTALFSALLTKVGVYSILRVFTLIFTPSAGGAQKVILVLSGLTMITGVLGAVAQMEFRRLLSFHIVSQIGYLLMGLGLFTVTALAGSVFFMIHVIIAKSALFLVSGVVHRLSGTYDLKKLGGFYRTHPGLSLLFLLPALALAGIPPLSGFWAKLALVRAGLQIEHYAIVAVALGVSILTLFSMTKIWTEVFWKPIPQETNPVASAPKTTSAQTPATMLLPICILAAITVIIGVAADPVFSLSERAAQQLLDRTAYINAVLFPGR